MATKFEIGDIVTIRDNAPITAKEFEGMSGVIIDQTIYYRVEFKNGKSYPFYKRELMIAEYTKTKLYKTLNKV